MEWCAQSWGIIWDLDGTLYCDDTPEMDDASKKAATQSIMDLCQDIDFQTAESLALNCYGEYGASIEHCFAPHNINEKDLHILYHAILDASSISYSEDVVAGFSQLYNSFRHVLLTHASGQWAQKVLERLQLTEFFPAERVIALENVGFCKKTEGTSPFLLALKTLGSPPDRTIFIDDHEENLAVAASLGIHTIHFSYPPQTHLDEQSTFGDLVKMILSHTELE
ncbi:MAG: HAD family hydrolase [Rhodospirillales bacterium]|nr:HAD family hydrolase [Rhodospirillales bacterium]